MLFRSGSLIITNLAGTLGNGDTFQLFNAANYSGAFASLTLPPLAYGLVWTTNTLATSGNLSVVATNTPVIANTVTSGSDLSLTGSGGVGYANYYVLSTTDLTLPLADWTPVLTNQFDSTGNFSITLTNVLNPNQPALFYRLQLQ